MWERAGRLQDACDGSYFNGLPRDLESGRYVLTGQSTFYDSTSVLYGFVMVCSTPVGFRVNVLLLVFDWPVLYQGISLPIWDRNGKTLVNRGPVHQLSSMEAHTPKNRIIKS